MINYKLKLEHMGISFPEGMPYFMIEHMWKTHHCENEEYFKKLILQEIENFKQQFPVLCVKKRIVNTFCENYADKIE